MSTWLDVLTCTYGYPAVAVFCFLYLHTTHNHKKGPSHPITCPKRQARRQYTQQLNFSCGRRLSSLLCHFGFIHPCWRLIQNYTHSIPFHSFAYIDALLRYYYFNILVNPYVFISSRLSFNSHSKRCVLFPARNPETTAAIDKEKRWEDIEIWRRQH